MWGGERGNDRVTARRERGESERERGESERAQSRKPPAREVIYIHAVMMVI